MDITLEHTSHLGDYLATGSPVMFSLFALEKGEGKRERNQNQAHLEELEHFSKLSV